MKPRGRRGRVLSERSSPEPVHNPGEMLLRGKARVRSETPNESVWKGGGVGGLEGLRQGRAGVK